MSVIVSATARDDVGVSGVQFLLDGAPLGPEDTTAPYTTTWNTTTATNASHTLTAVARNAAANTITSSAITVTVDDGAPPSDLVAAYGFEESVGKKALDSSGQTNTAVLDGPTRTVAGRFGRALSFDGVDDWVTVVDADTLDLTTGMTLEAWVRPAELNSWQTVILKERSRDLAYALYPNSTVNRPATHIWTTADLGLNGPAALAENAWTHLAATYDGTTLRLFVDGKGSRRAPRRLRSR